MDISMNKKPNCKDIDKCFFKDCEERWRHTCTSCTRNEDVPLKDKKEDYFTVFQRNGY